MTAVRTDFRGRELRRARRARIRFPASYRLVEEDGERATRPVESEALDISLLGVMLQTDELEIEGISLLPAMEPDPLTRIDMHLEIGSSEHTVNATGRVVWVRRSASGTSRKYTAGVVFSYLSVEAQQALRTFLDTQPAS
jgi:hypothetical protein